MTLRLDKQNFLDDLRAGRLENTPKRLAIASHIESNPECTCDVCQGEIRNRINEIRHEYDPRIGNLGHGIPAEQDAIWKWAQELLEEGYHPWWTPGKSIALGFCGAEMIKLLDKDYKPTDRWWVGWIKKEQDKYWVVAFEFVNSELAWEA